jgi:hypothetical protein
VSYKGDVGAMEVLARAYSLCVLSEVWGEVNDTICLDLRRSRTGASYVIDLKVE